MNVLIQVHTLSYLLAGVPQSIWGTNHASGPSVKSLRASQQCLHLQDELQLVECGKLHNTKAECFFPPLVPITMTSQCSTSVCPDSLHLSTVTTR